MSDSHASSESPTAASTEPQFIPEELVEFKADDREAGVNIGKMLVLFFICLLVLVSGVNLLMDRTVKMEDQEMTVPFADEGHGEDGHADDHHG